jgi:GntR family transcriptional regulator
MQLHVSPSDGVPIYQQVVNQIKYLVASGRLKQGEQLLPVRKLAEQLIVNPNTVARAYRELEAEGVVESRRGSGVFVSEGVSPLAKREQNKILNDRIDLLLAEAAHMNVDLEAVIKLVRQRSQQMR